MPGVDGATIRKLKDQVEILPRKEERGGAGAGRLDLNHATEEELVEIPGIGERVAQAIINYRKAEGEFTDVEQLRNLGFLDVMIGKVRDFLYVKKQK